MWRFIKSIDPGTAIFDNPLTNSRFEQGEPDSNLQKSFKVCVKMFQFSHENFWMHSLENEIFQESFCIFPELDVFPKVKNGVFIQDDDFIQPNQDPKTITKEGPPRSEWNGQSENTSKPEIHPEVFRGWLQKSS